MRFDYRPQKYHVESNLGSSKSEIDECLWSWFMVGEEEWGTGETESGVQN